MNNRLMLPLFFLLAGSTAAPGALGAVREYHLTIAQEDVRIRDNTAGAMTINGQIPGPTLYFEKGDTARIHVTNEMNAATSIHWHGLLVPPSMDGVPFVTQVPIQPGATFVYEFPIRQTGTYWYHSHSELQEQSGLYGSIVIDDGRHPVDRAYVVLLSDWTTEDPHEVLRTLKRGSHWYALEKGASQSIFGAAKAGRLGDYFSRELQRMPPMDIADVAYDYFLSNGRPETALAAEAGEKVRLRVINGSATTYFHLNFSGGPMTIISADGQRVEPVKEDLFLIGVAETYDVLVTLPERGAYELRATAHDGSGVTSTWLGQGEKHPARTIPRPDLYEPMAHGDAGSVLALTPAAAMGMSDARVEAGAFDHPGTGHGGHDMGLGEMPAAREHPGQHGGGGSMARGMPDHHGHGVAHKPEHDAMPRESSPSAHVHGQMPAAEHVGHEQMPAAGAHVSAARPFSHRFGLLEADVASRPELASEGGKERPSTPYARLKAAEPTDPPAGAPVREIRLTLDGDMQRYTWFIDNQPVSEADTIRVREGEVVRFILINRTMMHHPMHLHGHFFRVINGQGDRAPLKHTVDVAPMATTVIEFYTDEIGDWLFHCHLLYHMKSGMTRLVHYDGFAPAPEVAAIRSNLTKERFYFYGHADLLTNMTEGGFTLTSSRLELAAGWEAGWQEVEKTEWEAVSTIDYHVNRFTSVFTGVDVFGEGSGSKEVRGVAGLRYLLPLNVESSAWLDTDGGGRVMLHKELELTPRLALEGEVEYDTHEQWEGKVGFSYLVDKDVSILTHWHSEFGPGVGLQYRF